MTKRYNIYDDLTKDGRKNINVGEVMVFEQDGERKHYKVVKKGKNQVIIKETRLYTQKELDDIAKGKRDTIHG